MSIPETTDYKRVCAAFGIRITSLIWQVFGCAFLFSIVLLKFQFGPAILASEIFLACYLTEEVLKTCMLAPLIVSKSYNRYSLWMAMESILSLAGAVAALSVSRGPLAFLLGMTIGRILNSFIFMMTNYGVSYFRNADVQRAKSLETSALRYGWPVSLMAPLGWAGLYIDRYILSLAGGPALAGQYIAAAGFVSRPYSLATSSLTSYFRPQLFGVRGDGGGAEKAERNWLLLSGAIGILGVLCFAVLGSFIADLGLAAPYRNGAPMIMTLLALAQTLVIMTHGADNVILARGRSRDLLHLQVALLVAPLAIIPTGIWMLGAVGAAAGRCVVECLKLAFTTWLSYRLRHSSLHAEENA